MTVPGDVIKAMGLSIRSLHDGTPEDGATAALEAARFLGWEMHPTRGPEFEAMVERAVTQWLSYRTFTDAAEAEIIHDQHLPNMRAAIRAAVSAQGDGHE